MIVHWEYNVILVLAFSSFAESENWNSFLTISLQNIDTAQKDKTTHDADIQSRYSQEKVVFQACNIFLLQSVQLKYQPQTHIQTDYEVGIVRI